MRDWSDLQIDILNLIAERLYYTDQIRFRAVCKNWRSNIFNNINFADKLPWIMGYNATYTNKEILSSSFYLYEPSLKRRYRLENKILVGSELRASKYGWLLLSKNTKSFTSSLSFFFYCPFSGEIIKLPELLHMEDINQATFSTAPTSSDCVIFVICLYNYKANNKFCVSTCSPGDKTWHGLFFDGYYGKRIYNVAYANGVFYCAFHTDTGVMGAYNPALLEWKTHPYPPIEVNSLYLIESPEDGNLFLVPYLGSNRVFRFDWSRMKWFRVGNFMYSDDHYHKQIEIENLNSIIVFYGADNSSISLTAEGEASELANTVHNGLWLVVYRGRKGESRAQIGNWVVAEFYNWVDRDVSRTRKIWIQPPQIRS